jgi:hypothetical protein
MQPIRFAADTIIRSGHMRMYTASSAVHDLEVCRIDIEVFAKGCSMFIREAGPNEFENGFDAARAMNLTHVYLQIPKLWVLVFGDESLYFSVPVYRGKQFFPVKMNRGAMVADVANDRATRILLAEMESRGGIESEAFEDWRAKWLEATAQHSQKALTPSKVIH